MNSINPIYSINSSSLPVFRQKETDNKVVTNPINSSVSMTGLDALANYNKCNTAAITNKLNIPILQPIDIPENINEIEGERTFDEVTGDTTVIQKEANSIKRYIYESNGSHSYEVLDNNNNLLYLQGKNITPDGVYTKIIKQQPGDIDTKGVQALYRNGNLEHVSKYVIPPEDSAVGYPYEDIGYNAVSNTYYIEKCDNNNNLLTQYFDNNLKPISSDEYKIRNLVANENYMENTHEIQMKRDLDGDGEVSVDETLAEDYLAYKYPDLGEEDRKALIEYAKSDGNVNVSNEEFVRWLEGPEHGEILDEYRIREAEEIRKKRNI